MVSVTPVLRLLKETLFTAYINPFLDLGDCEAFCYIGFKTGIYPKNYTVGITNCQKHQVSQNFSMRDEYIGKS